MTRVETAAPALIAIDHVQLAAPAGCEDEAREFFGRLLGLPEIEKPKRLRDRGGVWFRCGSQELHVGVESDFAPAKKAHPAFRVSDAAGLRERLIVEGVDVKDDEPLPDARRFYAEDPFGNRLEFIERTDA